MQKLPRRLSPHIGIVVGKRCAIGLIGPELHT
jgi:hypothetical protein